MRVLLERDRLSVAAQNAEHDARMAVLTILREMGRSTVEVVELADALPGMRDIMPPDAEKIASSRPEVLSARAAVERARLNVTLQQANAHPDPEALFGYKRTAGYNTLMAGLQIDLPLRNRNQGAIAAAAAEVKSAEQCFTVVLIVRSLFFRLTHGGNCDQNCKE